MKQHPGGFPVLACPCLFNVTLPGGDRFDRCHLERRKMHTHTHSVLTCLCACAPTSPALTGEFLLTNVNQRHPVTRLKPCRLFRCPCMQEEKRKSTKQGVQCAFDRHRPLSFGSPLVSRKSSTLSSTSQCSPAAAKHPHVSWWWWCSESCHVVFSLSPSLCFLPRSLWHCRAAPSTSATTSCVPPLRPHPMLTLSTLSLSDSVLLCTSFLPPSPSLSLPPSSSFLLPPCALSSQRLVSSKLLPAGALELDWGEASLSRSQRNGGSRWWWWMQRGGGGKCRFCIVKYTHSRPFLLGPAHKKKSLVSINPVNNVKKNGNSEFGGLFTNSCNPQWTIFSSFRVFMMQMRCVRFARL